jgi:queuine/archaeosine tRNA-ribosyltransferase
MIQASQPDVCVAPYDPLWAATTTPTQSRAHKASRRTIKFLDTFLDKMKSTPVLGVLQGAHYPQERMQSAIETSKRNIDGK